MYSFGKTSRRKLNTCTEKLVELLEEAIETSPLDFCVLCGHRGEKEQNDAFNAGNSKLKFPRSRHNSFPSQAVDIAPFYKSSPHIRWEEIDDFKKLIKHIKTVAKKMKIEIDCGADWQTFKDYPHIELKEVDNG